MKETELPARGKERIQIFDRSLPINYMPDVPTPQQLEWQRGEMYMFIHFGINTFTGKEWGDGTDDPELFNPTHLDANQWVSVAKEAGFEGVMFTAKHHDGFALWPSAFTDYSVSASPWKEGNGDVLRELSDAAQAVDIKLGVYLSPWDRHEPSFLTPEYNDFYTSQLTELLTRYGDVYEVWFDGAIDPAIVRTGYDTERWYQTVRAHQPNSLIFGRLDLRWVGNEDGFSPETQWSPVEGLGWFPAECDARNRPGWFWREDEDAQVLSGQELIDIYFSSVGRNCVLLLNMPVNDHGLISEPDIREMRLFRRYLDEIFDENLALRGTASTSTTAIESVSWAPRNVIDGKEATFWVVENDQTSGWVELSFQDEITFNIISLQEPIQYGQRVSEYDVQTWVDQTGWVSVSAGTTIGYKKLDRLSAPVTAKKIRLTIIDAVGAPAIQEFALYHSELISGDNTN